MSFLTNVVDALQPKPAPKPQGKSEPKFASLPPGVQPDWLPADVQHQRNMAAIEAGNLKRADDARRAQLNHHLASEDRRKLVEQRDTFVAARNKDGKPLAHSEIH